MPGGRAGLVTQGDGAYLLSQAQDCSSQNRLCSEPSEPALPSEEPDELGGRRCSRLDMLEAWRERGLLYINGHSGNCCLLVGALHKGLWSPLCWLVLSTVSFHLETKNQTRSITNMDSRTALSILLLHGPSSGYLFFFFLFYWTVFYTSQ